MALDTYFRGNSEEVEFCRKIGAGGNHLVVVTAGGRVLGDKRSLRLRERELAGVLDEFAGLPDSDQRPDLVFDKDIEPPSRPVPEPPARGLIVRAFCTYLKTGEDGRAARPDVFYYAHNPDRWRVETQSDMLWLTETERKSLLPTEIREGAEVTVATAIQARFFSTIGIDFMEGSVNALPVRESTMTIRVERVDDNMVTLRLEGHGLMGKPYDEQQLDAANTRGCELRILGHLQCDRDANFTRFDVVGIGKAWGNKMSYTRREMNVGNETWMYGIACELVSGETPIERIPPYNLLHYNGSGRSYFSESGSR